MKAAPDLAIYLHGFNSSPQSGKARLFSAWCRDNLGLEVMVPALPWQPEKAIGLLASLLGSEAGKAILLVGSSLGAYYATWMVETMGAAGNLKAVLVNPAVAPCHHHSNNLLGRHRNQYSGAEFELTSDDISALGQMEIAAIRDPSRYLLLVQAGDELLDYRLALEYYRGCSQVVQQGGSHAFDNFEQVLPLIAAFAGTRERNRSI